MVQQHVTAEELMKQVEPSPPTLCLVLESSGHFIVPAPEGLCVDFESRLWTAG